jgi:hypothetical protein
VGGRQTVAQTKFFFESCVNPILLRHTVIKPDHQESRPFEKDYEKMASVTRWKVEGAG